MAIKYECPSCGATMSLAAEVNSVKCPVCRVDMAVVGEVEAAQSAPAARPAVVPPPPRAAATPATEIPAGIKIAAAVTDHPKHNIGGAAAVSTASADDAARKLMGSARSEADKVIQEAEKARAEILAHAEEHAREQVEAFFEQARKEAAETEHQAKADAETILAAAKRTAEKVGEKAREAADQRAEEEKKLAVLKSQMDQMSQELAARRKAAETGQTGEKEAGVRAKEAGAGNDARQALSDNDIAALTKSAVDSAVRQERKKHAKKSLNSKKSEVDHYAKREARFLLAGSMFGALVLAYSAFTLSQSSAAGLKFISLAMMGVDALIFLGLGAIIVGHYKAGNEVKKKRKKAPKKTMKPMATGNVKTPPSKRAQSKPAPAPPSPDRAKGAEELSEAKKIPLKVKMKTGKSTGVKGQSPANDALRKAAMRAAARRAAKKK